MARSAPVTNRDQQGTIGDEFRDIDEEFQLSEFPMAGTGKHIYLTTNQ
jgi:hypothetical protein